MDAFSAPKSLLETAKIVAAKKRMTKSGFYRYCLAKECGFSEEEAIRIAEPRAIANSIGNYITQDVSGVGNTAHQTNFFSGGAPSAAPEGKKPKAKRGGKK